MYRLEYCKAVTSLNPLQEVGVMKWKLVFSLPKDPSLNPLQEVGVMKFDPAYLHQNNMS